MNTSDQQMKELSDEVQKLRRVIGLICERCNLDIALLEKEAEYAECEDCGSKCKEECSCGCGSMACSCFAIFKTFSTDSTLYFYRLKCMERMLEKTSCIYTRTLLYDFIKTWKAQNE